MSVCFIEETGQKVYGTLHFEGILARGKWTLDEKGKSLFEYGKTVYIPVFKSFWRIESFPLFSKVVVDEKFEFNAYCGSVVCGVYSLIGKDPVDEFRIGKN